MHELIAGMLKIYAQIHLAASVMLKVTHISLSRALQQKDTTTAATDNRRQHQEMVDIHLPAVALVSAAFQRLVLLSAALGPIACSAARLSPGPQTHSIVRFTGYMHHCLCRLACQAYVHNLHALMFERISMSQVKWSSESLVHINTVLA